MHFLPQRAARLDTRRRRSHRAMPKRILGLSIAFSALVLAACNNGTGIITPPATATPGTPVPNPAYTAATVTVTVAGSPLPNQPVVLSTPDANGRAGAAIATQTTGSNGQTIFNPLTGAANYCFATTVTPAPSPAPTPLVAYQEKCTTFWAAGVNLAF